MKVLLLNTLYAPARFGGVERMVQSLAENLVQFGHEVVLVSTTPDGDASARTLNGVRVHGVSLRNVYQIFPVERRRALLKPLWHAIDTANVAMSRHVAKILDAERPDVLHTHNLTGFSALAWKPAFRRRIPIVHTLHDYYLLCVRSTMFHRGRNCSASHFPCSAYAAPRVRLSNKVAAVVGASRFVLDRHLEHGAFSRARLRRVIHNPVVVESTPAAATPVRSGRALRIGFLGRLDPIKGVDVLLDALSGLPNADWTLEIAGWGNESYVRELQLHPVSRAVRFVGHVEPEQFLARIDVLVVPSKSHDTLPLVIGEAYQFGVPVIGGRRGGLPEIVDEGRTGFLFDPNKPAELRALLARLIDSPEVLSGMRANCVAAAAAYAPARIARQYEALYAELAEHLEAPERRPLTEAR